jgi:hypothetical protein
VSISSWVGSVWSLRGDENLVIGQVREVDGEMVTMAVVGLGGAAPEGVEVVPSHQGSGQFARVSSGTLLGRWKRMGGGSVGAPA